MLLIATQSRLRLQACHGVPLISKAFLATQHTPQPRPVRYGAVVIGSGPAGLAVVGNLLERDNKSPVLWVDDRLRGGRLHKAYREVPSNTKVKRFVAYADAVRVFRQITKSTRWTSNPYTHLKSLDQEATCHIAEAADLCLMLTQGLKRMKSLTQHKGRVVSANRKDDGWEIEVATRMLGTVVHTKIETDNIVLCTGSSPRLQLKQQLDDDKLQYISLDLALKPSLLPTVIAKNVTKDAKVVVGVVGASHSAILVLRNLYNLASSSHPHLQIKWFTRHDLRYAEERGDWIYRDNTGLKGEVATWAKDNLEPDKLPTSSVNQFLSKISTAGITENEYHNEIKTCTHIVEAVGFKADETVKFAEGSGPLTKVFNHETGSFTDSEGKEIEGLFGAGIAYPEKVVDPEGNVEYAVGLFKFTNFLARAVPAWKMPKFGSNKRHTKVAKREEMTQEGEGRY